MQRDFIDRYEKALAPWTKARGIDWEVQIEQCDVSHDQAYLILCPMPNLDISG